MFRITVIVETLYTHPPPTITLCESANIKNAAAFQVLVAKADHVYLLNSGRKWNRNVSPFPKKLFLWLNRSFHGVDRNAPRIYDRKLKNYEKR